MRWGTVLVLALIVVSPAAASADVVVSVERGSLILAGDGGDDFVYVTEVEAGMFEVGPIEGFEASSLVNGGDVPVVFDGVVRDVVARLGEGNNVLAMYELEIPRDLVVETGVEEDALLLSGVTTHGRVRASLGAGANSFELVWTSIDRDFSYAGGAGDDALTMVYSDVGGSVRFVASEGANDLYIADTLVIRSLSFHGRGGPDSVEIGDSAVGGSTKIDAGAGLNELQFSQTGFGSGFDLRAGADSDTIRMNGCNVSRSARISGGGGDDSYEISRSTFLGTTSIRGGYGSDEIEITGGPTATEFYRSLSILLPGGDNTVLIGEPEDNPVLVYADLKVATGEGDDVITIDSTTSIDGSVRVTPGSGSNTVSVP